MLNKITVKQMLQILAEGGGAGLVTFGVFMSLTLFVMYIMCSAGEQLVTEVSVFLLRVM